jgi:hypothetical protein
VAETSSGQWFVILGSCVAGTLIGWAGWQCRSLVSATSYTLIGVVNKLLTVVMSVLFLDKHASPTGITALCLCIAASTQYSQPPMRKQGDGDGGGGGGGGGGKGDSMSRNPLLGGSDGGSSGEVELGEGGKGAGSSSS